jgi:flagellar motor switch protein FliM
MEPAGTPSHSDEPSSGSSPPSPGPPDENQAPPAPEPSLKVLPDADTPPPAPADSAGPSVSRYDFRHPSLLTPSETRKLRLRHDEFARSLTARFSIYLRLEFGFQITRLETVPFYQFIESRSVPAHFTLFKLEPLEGLALLEITPAFALMIVDRLMGGPGKAIPLDRDLSEIEKALLDQAAQVVLKEWSQHVCRQPEARPVFLGHETNGRFLQIAANDCHMVVVTLEAGLGEAKETLHLAFPYEMLEPVIRQLGSLAVRSPGRIADPTQTASPAPAWNRALDNVPLPVVARWTGLQLPARKLTELKVGDVLPVEARYGDQVQIRLARNPKFIGRLGRCGKSWAVELTAAISR